MHVYRFPFILLPRKDLRSVVRISFMEAVLQCSNCEAKVDADDLRPISIGAIIRHAKTASRTFLLHAEELVSHEGGMVEAEAALSKESLIWIVLPQVLARLSRPSTELLSLPPQSPLSRKTVRVCSGCFDLFADEVELKRIQNSGKPRPTNSTARSGVAPQNGNGEIDMVFTDIQLKHRDHEKILRKKANWRATLAKSYGDQIDWTSLPTSAAVQREMKSVYAASRVPIGTIQQTPDEPEMLEWRTTASPTDETPKPNEWDLSLTVAHASPSVFDISYSERLCLDLFQTLKNKCQFASIDNAIQSGDPLFEVYRLGRNRFPEPPRTCWMVDSDRSHNGVDDTEGMSRPKDLVVQSDLTAEETCLLLRVVGSSENTEQKALPVGTFTPVPSESQDAGENDSFIDSEPDEEVEYV
jgi:hypothetical protein